jgi:hypothetical protein
MRPLLLLTAVCLAAPASAAPSESARVSAVAGFGAAAGFAPKFQPRLSAKQGDKAAKATGVKPIRLSGHVWLDGSGYVGQGQRHAMVTVSGYTQLQDQDGKWLNGQIRVSSTDSYWINGSHVSGWARPYAYVNIYSNSGKFLGSVNVSGSIHVSGWANGSWLNLRGSGYVNGSGTINEEEKP